MQQLIILNKKDIADLILGEEVKTEVSGMKIVLLSEESYIEKRYKREPVTKYKMTLSDVSDYSRFLDKG